MSVLSGLLVLLAAVVQEAAPSKTRVEELIKRMGSDSAEVRDQALEELKGLGKPALPAIKAALPEVNDPEVKARIGHLLRKLEPAALQALEDYLETAKVDAVAIDVLKDDAVGKTLPEVIFFQVWKRGQTAAWKVLGFDTAKKELFDAAEPAAWAVYTQDRKRDAVAVQKADHLVRVAAAAPHASIVAYSAVPSLFLKLGSRAVNVWVKADGHTLEARSLEGKPLWEVDVERVCGGNVGAPVVRLLKESRGGISLIFGKHSHATLDLETGKVLGRGSD